MEFRRHLFGLRCRQRNEEETMRLLIEGAMVWDGTGAPPFPGKVLVEGERIAAIAQQSETVASNGAERLDAAGKFLMPGMIEGHAGGVEALGAV